MNSGKRVVRPDRMIKFNRELWRARHEVPDWVIPGTRVRALPNTFRNCLWVSTTNWNEQERFVRESDWLPEGF